MSNKEILIKELSRKLTELLLDYPNDILFAMDTAREDEAIAFYKWMDDTLSNESIEQLYNEFKSNGKSF